MRLHYHISTIWKTIGRVGDKNIYLLRHRKGQITYDSVWVRDFMFLTQFYICNRNRITKDISVVALCCTIQNERMPIYQLIFSSGLAALGAPGVNRARATAAIGRQATARAHPEWGRKCTRRGA